MVNSDILNKWLDVQRYGKNITTFTVNSDVLKNKKAEVLNNSVEYTSVHQSHPEQLLKEKLSFLFDSASM